MKNLMRQLTFDDYLLIAAFLVALIPVVMWAAPFVIAGAIYTVTTLATVVLFWAKLALISTGTGLVIGGIAL